MTKLVAKFQPGGSPKELSMRRLEEERKATQTGTTTKTTPNVVNGIDVNQPGMEGMLNLMYNAQNISSPSSYSPSTVDNTGQLKQQYLLEKAKTDPIVNKTVTTPESGISVNASPTKLVAGNYQNIAALNARQRKLLRKNGGQYVGRNGQVYTIGAGTSREEMRKIYNQARQELKDYRGASELGLGDEANDVFKAYANNPNARYIIYHPEKAAEQQAAQQGGQATPSSYTYNFGSELNDKTGLGNLYIQIAKGMGLNNWAKYANNGVIDLDSMKRYILTEGGLSDFNGTDFTNDNLTALNTKLGTNYTYTPDQAAKPAATQASDNTKLSQETVNLLKSLFNNAEIRKIIGQKRGGKMNKFQMGGAVNQQQVAQELAAAQQQLLTEIFQAIALKPQETLMALLKQGIQPKQIIDLAQKMADKNPAAKAALQALSQMLQMAREGAKLQYIKRLRGECPEGYELKMFKAGGKVCTKCEKIKKKEDGGTATAGAESKLVSEFKAHRCGGRMKKKQEGGEVNEEKCGGKMKKK